MHALAISVLSETYSHACAAHADYRLQAQPGNGQMHALLFQQQDRVITYNR